MSDEIKTIHVHKFEIIAQCFVQQAARLQDRCVIH